MTTLSEQAVGVLEAAYQATKNGAERTRLQAVRLYGQGYKVEQIHQMNKISGSLGIAVVDILVITHQEDMKEFFSFSSKMNNKSLLFYGFLVS